MRWAILILLGVLSPLPAIGQFSPGELSRAHTALEGSTHCADCHEVGKTISGQKCLTCHQEINTLVNARRGLHGAAAGKPCTGCHIEHLGLDARTVRFDTTGFDHASAGFALAGKHASVACARCHMPARIKDAVVLDGQKKYPHRTFLGLTTACSSCHADPHGPGASRNCVTCHSPQGWKPVTGFEHAATKFPLGGKHASVECARCHAGFGHFAETHTVSFATKSSTDCTPCHSSPHKTRMADASCSSCHTPAGWQSVKGGTFDHASTAFPLRGRHAVIRCEQCHSGRTGSQAGNLHPRHNRCSDCHADVHAGVFEKAYNNDCALCHTENGFTPSTFTIARHAKSRFILTGSHAAVLCVACHKRTGTAKPVFVFPSLRCQACHADYHKGTFKSRIAKTGCEGCHVTDGWKDVRFDHEGTGFTLRGRHADVPCAKCHATPADAVASVSSTDGSPVRECQACHKDAHQGQFATLGVTPCARCHSAEGWKMLRFTHEESKFPLTGAHKNVPCAGCHRPEIIDGKSVTRFASLDARCESCHTGRTK